MLFNLTRNHDFPPEFTMGGSGPLQVKQELKILGVQIQNDLKWGEQVKQMTTKASRKIWLLRRMKQLGVDEATITEYWRSEGLVHLEFCAPVWSGGISRQQAQALSRVHRRAVAEGGRSTPHPAAGWGWRLTSNKDDFACAGLLLGAQLSNQGTKIYLLNWTTHT